MKGSAFLNMTPRSQATAAGFASCLLCAGFLLRLIFMYEDGGKISLRNAR
jgi:hypothetical protein